ncbi:uncharacterized protein LOC116302696 [Actinia tenebrosa]|uniref:Uncharacterized protein LOC116302696 n=1 Tax=Actinia tenebrosa TaxID=6105 RepID=A0A6P8ILR0_ACTTE|nr:uncharacterized protein LOC116302696 [Actinia tenebrosa]XP_031567906.1 uncharacterized protein LOC116302696 [Actinia tenebrosa]XP_031567907.1 uncharacterized protein LOC116302696 [Actinia tenebrosa]
MAVSESTCVSTIMFMLSILLTIGQIITAVVLIILVKAFWNLRRRVLDYEKNLPLVRLETPQRINTTTATKPLKRASTTASSKRLEDGEEATVVPTPNPGNRRSVCEQQVPHADDCTMTVPRTQSTSAQKLLELIHNVSFESFSSPRDSGTGSASTTSPNSSISYELQRSMKESFSKREGSSTLPKTKSWGSQGSKSCDAPFESGRSLSTASCGPSRPTRYGSHFVKFLSKKPINENDFRPSRLKTISIEMIGQDDDDCPNETKSKRASRILREMEEDASEEPAAIEEVGFCNEGYHASSNRSSPEVSKNAPLASEESVSSSNSESVNEINNNDFEKLDSEDEYENQEVVDAMRYNSVGSKKGCSSKQNEPVCVKSSTQP